MEVEVTIVIIPTGQGRYQQPSEIYFDFCRSFAIIDPSGFWLGEDDGGLGSPSLRHTGCQHGVHAKKPYIEDIPQAADSMAQ